MVRPAYALIGAALAASASYAARAQAEEASTVAPPERKGTVIVAPGPPDEDLARACKDLAREAYRIEALRPRAGEAAVRTLCGGDPGTSAEAKQLAELRAALSPSIATASTRVLASALLDELGVASLAIVARDAEPGSFQVRVVRAGTGERGASFVEPTVLEVVPAGDPPALPWTAVAAAIEILSADEGESRADRSSEPLPALPGPAPVPVPSGPRRDLLVGSKPAPPPDAPKEKAFYESPWFWVAAGSVAAVGLTVLIVSQTTDVGEGTVEIKGKVLP